MTTPEKKTYGIADDPRSVALEHERLAALTAWRDPRTFAVLSEIGVAPGWDCLEVGAGSGTVSQWLAERVMPGGSVLSGDIDLRFHCEAVPGMEVRRLDILEDPLPDAAFDLIHARALFMHLPDAERALDRMVAALKPGGWIVVEDGDWRAFEAQPLPEPLASVAALMQAGLRMGTAGDKDVGTRLLRMFDERGLVELEVSGEVRTMHGGHYTMSWWAIGIEHASGRMLESGAVTPEQIEGALEIVKSPDFVMVAPLSYAVRGRTS